MANAKKLATKISELINKEVVPKNETAKNKALLPNAT